MLREGTERATWGELPAGQLSKAVSRDEADPDVLLTIWDSNGHNWVKKGSSTVATPSRAEQQRLTLTVTLRSSKAAPHAATKAKGATDTRAPGMEPPQPETSGYQEFPGS